MSDISWSKKSSIDQKGIVSTEPEPLFHKDRKNRYVLSLMKCTPIATTKTNKSLGCLTLNKWACPVSLSCKLFSINYILWPGRASLLVTVGQEIAYPNNSNKIW